MKFKLYFRLFLTEIVKINKNTEGVQNPQTLDYRFDNQAFVNFAPPQYLTLFQAIFFVLPFLYRQNWYTPTTKNSAAIPKITVS